jgi:asparagine synthetase B (glutamine-hydrolysing)
VCGILGAYDIAAVDDRRLTAVSEAIVHRDPDCAGSWTSLDDGHRVQVGNRYLSIVDLSAAAD